MDRTRDGPSFWAHAIVYNYLLSTPLGPMTPSLELAVDAIGASSAVSNQKAILPIVEYIVAIPFLVLRRVRGSWTTVTQATSHHLARFTGF